LQLSHRTARHPLDGLTRWFGVRLLVIELWIEASPSEEARLRNAGLMTCQLFTTFEGTEFRIGQLCASRSVRIVRSNMERLNAVRIAAQKRYDQLLGPVMEFDELGMTTAHHWDDAA
jgi:hypothetical protein